MMIGDQATEPKELGGRKMPKIVVYFDDKIPRNYLNEFATFLRKFRFVEDVRIVGERQRERRRSKTT